MPNGVSAPGQVSPPLVPMNGLTYWATSLGVQPRSVDAPRSADVSPISGEPPPPTPSLMSTSPSIDASGPLPLECVEQAPAPSDPATTSTANEERMRHH